MKPRYFNQLQVRVNYGAGTVNNHGIQLFIFDKKGRIAAICDNDAWSASDVKKFLVNLNGRIIENVTNFFCFLQKIYTKFTVIAVCFY